MTDQDFCEVYYKKRESTQSIKELRTEVLEQAFFQSFGVTFSEQALRRESFGKPYYDFGQTQETCGYFNLSHTKEFVAVACASCEVGVDMEFSRKVSEAAMRRSCTVQEYRTIMESNVPQREFLKYWTLKESYVKMTGEGMSVPFSEINFVIDKKEHGYEVRSNKRETFWIYEIEDGFLSVCLPHEKEIQKDFVKVIRL